MLRPDGVSVQLGSTGADELGRGGMPGFVDNHYAQRYGSAVLLSLIGGGAQFLQNWGFGAQQAVKTISRTLPDGSVETITSDASELQAQARQAYGRWTTLIHVLKNWQRRRDLKKLLAVDDGMLGDLGIERDHLSQMVAHRLNTDWNWEQDRSGLISNNHISQQARPTKRFIA